MISHIPLALQSFCLPCVGSAQPPPKRGPELWSLVTPSIGLLLTKTPPPPLVALPPFQSSTKMWAAVTLLALDFCGAHPLGLPFSSMIGTIRVS